MRELWSLHPRTDIGYIIKFPEESFEEALKQYPDIPKTAFEALDEFTTKELEGGFQLYKVNYVTYGRQVVKVFGEEVSEE